MRDFKKIPGEDFGLFLIRKTKALDSIFLDSLHSDILRLDLNISFERLIKGDKSALVTYLPKALAQKYKDSLDLLELEDYVGVNINHVLAWEASLNKGSEKYFKNFPPIGKDEQFWWQFVLLAESERSFSLQIKAVSISPNNFDSTKISTPSQLIDFYRKRTFTKGSKVSGLDSSDVLKLLTL